jgi:hypothetical protein
MAEHRLDDRHLARGDGVGTWREHDGLGLGTRDGDRPRGGLEPVPAREHAVRAGLQLEDAGGAPDGRAVDLEIGRRQRVDAGRMEARAIGEPEGEEGRERARRDRRPRETRVRFERRLGGVRPAAARRLSRRAAAVGVRSSGRFASARARTASRARGRPAARLDARGGVSVRTRRSTSPGSSPTNGGAPVTAWKTVAASA